MAKAQRGESHCGHGDPITIEIPLEDTCYDKPCATPT